MRKHGRPLTQLTDLKAEYIHKIGRLWLTTVEEVAGIIKIPEIIAGISQNMIISLFSKELEVPAERADEEFIQVVRKSISDNEWYAMAALEKPLSFGLLLDGADQMLRLLSSGSPTLTHKNLPSRINLLEQFPKSFSDIKDQEQRGTCVAFAVTSLHEYIHSQIQNHPSPLLSEEFLYWAARNKQYEYDANSCHECGTYIVFALQALLQLGQCRDETKPYRKDLPCNLQFCEGDAQDSIFICQNECEYNNPSYLASGLLLPDLQAEASTFRLTGWKSVKLSTIQDIKLALYNGRPVVIGVRCYLSWQNPTLRHSGVITFPFQQEIDDEYYQLGAHAMLVVGYEDDAANTVPATPGGGYLILRNSWGKRWGDTSPTGYQAGYGVIPYSYLTRQFIHAYTLAPA